MMYTMPKNLLSICVNFALATQRARTYFLNIFEAKFSLLYHTRGVKI